MRTFRAPSPAADVIAAALALLAILLAPFPRFSPGKGAAMLLSHNKALLAALLAIASLCVFAVPPAQATPTLDQLAAEVAALQTQVQSLQNTVTSQASTIQTLQTWVNNHAPTLNRVNKVTSALTVQNGVGKNTELFISGVNVHIVNGLGATNGNPNDPADINAVPTVNGLGNLIIGYNVNGNINGDNRTGSHNLIIGDQNNYSSFAGIVAGLGNSVSGIYSQALGGDRNIASGLLSVTLGGEFDQATGLVSVMIGGIGNTASGSAYSAAIGGEANKSTGFGSVVSGGLGNTASGQFSAVSGGNAVTQSTNDGWAGGGLHSP